MKSITGFAKSWCHLAARRWLEWRLARQSPTMSLEPSHWEESLKNPTDFYFECLRYFFQRLPKELRRHRAYFRTVRSNRRGFGENSFHVMWYLLFQEFKPSTFLEIGVFRGQTISLASLCARMVGCQCEVHGISPFSTAGDAVSRYRYDIDYYDDTLANFEHFGLARPHLLRAYSTDSAAVDLIGSKEWDMIYIDGNHEYEVAAKDWNICSRHTKAGGIVVLDDSALTTSFHPPAYAAARGHPGPSRVGQEVDRSRFREILQVGHNRAFQRIR